MEKNLKIYAITARIIPTGKNKQQKFKPAFRTFTGVICDENNRKKEDVKAFAQTTIKESIDGNEVTYKVEITGIDHVNKHFTFSTPIS